ncbi:hypothetical protein [Pseudarthrobacter sp. NamB4]|uniref:hypothetical protein n=1 Tax=Pseudarthrobacter sp. NamB4 TaxID=2576837 RepID=UPI0010FF07B5|nr:hypothetical protein [Pseudarthrobacter sp. NamB4]TLM75327.1 hypothetical protein FDW81_01545 [Pseudarthrobacter sp. NamB4]
MIDYLNMSVSQAQSAFQEFLDEREAALERLRIRLLADGQNPAVLLDGTVDSLVPLWRWIVSRLTGPRYEGATDPGSVARDAWPSWERYTREEERVLSLESLALLDGLVSYLAVVVRTHAPTARWEIARHRIKRYAANNHPVLVSGSGEIHNFLPGIPESEARALLLGLREVPDDVIARYARTLIDGLNAADSGVDQGSNAGDEPLLEVEDLGGDELRGRELEVSLREDIAHQHSPVVGRLVKTLAKQEGITGVVREDREILLVATGSWTTEQLERWITRYLQDNINS